MNNSRRGICFALAAAVATMAASAGAVEITPLEIGAQAPDFDLPGVDDRQYSLADFAEAKILVVVFTCNHCPTAQAYEDRLIKLCNEYKDKGTALVAISPNAPDAVNLSELGYTELGDSFEEMKVRAHDRNFPFPYLYDGETQSTAKAYGVLATPHVFIFDRQRRLRYVGRVDDNDIGPPKSHDARNAIDALLADKPVPVEKTKVFGCSTKWKDKSEHAKELLKRWQAEEVTLKDLDLAGVKKLAAGDGEKHRLINVWATWCAPCVDELPYFVDMNRMYRRRPVEVITICFDDPARKDKALEMLKTAYASTANYIYTGEDKDAFVNALDPQWEGPVAYTLIISPKGEVVYRHQGEITPVDVRKALVEKIGRTYADRR